MIIKVPLSLKSRAMQDLDNFIRDIANVTETGTRPFIRRRKKIRMAVKDYLNPFLPLTKDFLPGYQCIDDYRRFMHIDLAHTRDSVGIAMCHVPTFVEREEIDTFTKEIERVLLPVVKVDFWGKLTAMKREEIILSDVREIIYKLSKLGFYFGLITFDRFQSLESIQTLRRYGYIAGHHSVDRTTSALIIDYEDKSEVGYTKQSTEGNNNATHVALRDLLYDDRLEVPNSDDIYDTDWFVYETENAQYTKTGKIDHPPTGSLDVEQAIAGSVFHAINNEKTIMETEEERYKKESEDKFYKTAEEKIDDRLLKNNLEGYSLPIDPRSIEDKYF
ncbi:MAG: hypothetical protein ACFFKA_07005 [Candidatus Thorarchaeota archaeon]